MDIRFLETDRAVGRGWVVRPGRAGLPEVKLVKGWEPEQALDALGSGQDDESQAWGEQAAPPPVVSHEGSVPSIEFGWQEPKVTPDIVERLGDTATSFVSGAVGGALEAASLLDPGTWVEKAALAAGVPGREVGGVFGEVFGGPAGALGLAASLFPFKAPQASSLSRFGKRLMKVITGSGESVVPPGWGRTYRNVPLDVRAKREWVPPGRDAARYRIPVDHSGNILASGFAVKIEDLPEDLYHVTTNLLNVHRSGRLLADPSSVSPKGLGQFGWTYAVSLTTHPFIAAQLAHDLRNVIALAKIKDPEHFIPRGSRGEIERGKTAQQVVLELLNWRKAKADFGMAMLRQMEKMAEREHWGEAFRREMRDFIEISRASRRGEEPLIRNGFMDYIGWYYDLRHMYTGAALRDPVFMGNYLGYRSMDPDLVGIVKIKKSTLEKTGALITAMDHPTLNPLVRNATRNDPMYLKYESLYELRHFGDIPLDEASFYLHWNLPVTEPIDIPVRGRAGREALERVKERGVGAGQKAFGAATPGMYEGPPRVAVPWVSMIPVTEEDLEEPPVGSGQDSNPEDRMVVPYSPGMLSIIHSRPFNPDMPPILWPPLTHEGTRRMNDWHPRSLVGSGQDSGWDVFGRVGRRVAEEASGWRVPVLDPILGMTQLGLEGLTNVLRYPAGVAKGLGDIALGAAGPGEEDVISPGGAVQQFSEIPGAAQLAYDVGASLLPGIGWARFGGKAIGALLRIPSMNKMAPVISPFEGSIVQRAAEALAGNAAARRVGGAARWAVPLGLAAAGMVTTPDTSPEGKEYEPEEKVLSSLGRSMSGLAAGLLLVPGAAAAMSLLRRSPRVPIMTDDPEELASMLRLIERSRHIQREGDTVVADLRELSRLIYLQWPGGWWGYQLSRLRQQITDRYAALEDIQRAGRESLGGKLPWSARPYEMARLTAGLSGQINEHYRQLSQSVLRYQKVERKGVDQSIPPLRSIADAVRPRIEAADNPLTSKEVFRAAYATIEEMASRRPSNVVEWGLKDEYDLALFETFAELVSRADRAVRGVDKVDPAKPLMALAQFIDRKVVPHDPYGPARYLETMRRLDVARRPLYEEAERFGVLSPGDTERIFSSRQYYVAWRDVDVAFDDWGKIQKGDRLFQVTDPVSYERPPRGTYSTATMENLLEHDAQILTAIGRNRVGLAFLDLAKRDPDGVGTLITKWEGPPQGPLPQGMAVWPIFIKGKMTPYLVPKALRDVLASFEKPQVDMITQWISKFNSRIFRAGVTSLSFAFLARNPIRDFFSAFQNFEHPVLFLREYLPAWVDVIREVANRLGMPVKSGTVGDFYRLRGGIGAFFEQGLEAKKPSEVIFGRSKIIGSLADYFEALGALSELPSRVAVFRAAMKKGYLPEEAAFIARSRVVDFSKGGYALRTLNMWFPLINARVQGELQSWDSLSKDPLGFSLRLGAETAAFVATYAWNRLAYSDLYDEIPVETLDRNMVLVFGSYFDERDGKERPLYLKLPLNDVQMASFGALRQALDEAFHTQAFGQPLEKHQRTARSDERLWREILSGLLPVDAKPDELDPPGLLMALVAGQPLAGMAAQLYANRDHFYGRPIVDPSLSHLPKVYQYDEKTTTTARLASKLLSDLGVPQGWHIAPAEIDFVARSLGGTFAQTVMGSLDVFLESLGVRPPEPKSPQDLGIDPDTDPSLWQRYLQSLATPDTRPLLARALAAWVGAGGGQLSGIAKSKQMSPRDQEVWQQTVRLYDDYRAWLYTTYYRDRQALLDEHGTDWTHGKILDEYFRLQERRREHLAALRAKYPLAIIDPQQRREFIKRMPGVPLGAEYSAALASLPKDLPPGMTIGEMASRYWNPPGIDLSNLNPVAQAEARNAELQRMSAELGRLTGTSVDPRVLKDAITAFTRGVELPSLPLPAVHVEDWASRYMSPRDPATGKGIDPTKVSGDVLRELRRAEVTRIVREYKILDFLREKWREDGLTKQPTERDAEAYVLERINTYFRSPEESDPLSQSIERSLRLSSDIRDSRWFPPFVDRAGRALGGPEEWERWEAILDKWSGVDRRRWPKQVLLLDMAKRMARVRQLSALYSDPDYVHYQRFFGIGRSMTPYQWEAYQTGMARKYLVGGPSDWARFDGIVAIYRTLPDTDAMKRRMAPLVKRISRLAAPGWRGTLELDELNVPAIREKMKIMESLYLERAGG